jgi:hypothetical protein
MGNEGGLKCQKMAVCEICAGRTYPSSGARETPVVGLSDEVDVTSR